MEQKKYVIITNAIEALTKLKAEKRLEGVLFIDKNTCKLTFRAYNRQCGKRPKDRMLYQMEHGWLKESKERIKLFESVPKGLGAERIMAVFERETRETEGVLTEREKVHFC
jgi:hypothetical protein